MKTLVILSLFLSQISYASFVNDVAGSQPIQNNAFAAASEGMERGMQMGMNIAERQQQAEINDLQIQIMRQRLIEMQANH